MLKPIETDQILGGFRIGARRASGDLEDSFEAVELKSGRAVQLDIPRNLTSAIEATRARVLHDGHALCRLRHANVRRILSIGEADGYILVAGDLETGTGLDEYLRHQLTGFSDIYNIFTQILVAVEGLHAAGLVHRFLEPGAVRISELGAVTVTNVRVWAERPSRSPYTAPECRLGKPATPASDIYSCGVLLYHLLTLSAPKFASDGSLLFDSRLERIIPEPLQAYVRKLCDWNLNTRPKTIADLATLPELSGLMSGLRGGELKRMSRGESSRLEAEVLGLNVGEWRYAVLVADAAGISLTAASTRIMQMTRDEPAAAKARWPRRALTVMLLALTVTLGMGVYQRLPDSGRAPASIQTILPHGPSVGWRAQFSDGHVRALSRVNGDELIWDVDNGAGVETTTANPFLPPLNRQVGELNERTVFKGNPMALFPLGVGRRSTVVIEGGGEVRCQVGVKHAVKVRAGAFDTWPVECTLGNVQTHYEYATDINFWVKRDDVELVSTEFMP